jgi:hypothetical protein
VGYARGGSSPPFRTILISDLSLIFKELDTETNSLFVRGIWARFLIRSISLIPDPVSHCAPSRTSFYAICPLRFLHVPVPLQTITVMPIYPSFMSSISLFIPSARSNLLFLVPVLPLYFPSISGMTSVASDGYLIAHTLRSEHTGAEYSTTSPFFLFSPRDRSLA